MNWRGGIVFFTLIAAGFTFWGFLQNWSKVYPPAESTPMKKTIEIKITSSAFGNNTAIPSRFTCDGQDISPPLEISGVPAEAKSLALVMHDPDAPIAGGWTHWVKFNAPWDMEHGALSIGEGTEPEGTSGKGSGNNLLYQGPCPPSGTHRYFFKIYALDTILNLKTGATKTEVEKVMVDHIVGQGELVGLYARRN